jgi:hypothetical protein
MLAAEFQAKIINGKIDIPAELRGEFPGDVKVILFAAGADADPASWPAQNRRRWELISKKISHALTAAEKQELASLQQQADEQLAKMGPRPLEELERLYVKLSQEG